MARKASGANETRMTRAQAENLMPRFVTAFTSMAKSQAPLNERLAYGLDSALVFQSRDFGSEEARQFEEICKLVGECTVPDDAHNSSNWARTAPAFYLSDENAVRVATLLGEIFEAIVYRLDDPEETDA